MSWYKKSNQLIDARLAYEGAGAMGRGLSGVGSAMSNYAKLNYKKKRDKKNDINLQNENSTKIKTHEIDYKKSTDTATINNSGKVKVATINKDADTYVTDGRKAVAKIDYKKSTDTATIAGKAKVKSSTVSATAKKYSANVSASNNKRTTKTLKETTIAKTKTQRYVADQNVKSAKVKSTKKRSVPKLKIKSLDDVEALLKNRNKKKVDDQEI